MTGRKVGEAVSAAFPLRSVISLGTILAAVLGGFYGLSEQVAVLRGSVEASEERALASVGSAEGRALALIAATKAELNSLREAEDQRLELMIVENRARARALAEAQNSQADRLEADIAEIKTALQQLVDRERESLLNR